MRGRLPTPAWAAAVLCVSVVSVARAQEETIVLDLFRSRVDVGVDRVPDRSFEDGIADNPVPGGFASSTVSLSTILPLGGVHVRPDAKRVASQLFAGVMLQRSSTDILALPRYTLYQGLVSVSNVWLSRGHELYFASAGASFAEDQETIGSLEPRFFGLFVGTHHLGADTSLLYGGSFTYVFGRALPLPIIGVRWKIDSEWTLTGMVPFVVDARYQARKNLVVGIRLAPRGNQYRCSNEGRFPGQDDIVYLSLVEGRLFGEVEWKSTSNISLLARVGVSRVRRLAFEDRDRNEFFNAGTQTGGFAQIALRATFGKTILDELKD